MEKTGDIRTIIEARPTELLGLSVSPRFTVDLQAYAAVVFHYLEGDLERLVGALSQVNALEAQASPWTNSLQRVARFRLELRQGHVSEADLLSRESQVGEDALSGETLFLCGLGWERLKRDDRAVAAFARAHQIFLSVGCPRKGLRSLYNRVCAESRLIPHKSYLLDYQSIVNAARAIQENEFAGMALLMLSREYQVLGLGDRALEMAQEGLRALESERGCLHFFHGLLHTAHLLVEAGRETEALDLICEAQLAPFAEIKAARQLLLRRLDPLASWDEELEAQLMPTWRERVVELLGETQRPPGELAAVPLTPLERRLVQLLWRNPTTKWEVVSKLYQDTDDSVVLENRFKNLVGRLRKKYPNALFCRGGKYHVSGRFQSLVE